MFDLQNSLIIGSPLFPFVLLVQTGGGDGYVAGSMWVEDSHIEEGCVEFVSSEPVCLHVESSIVFSDGSGVCHFLPLRGCRWGSTDTLWYTFKSISAVMFLSSLCRMIGKPPRLQLRVCSTLNCFPYLHALGILSSFHPYLRHTPSQNAPLWRLNPCSVIGRTASQWEAPFSWERIIACFCGASRVCVSRSASPLSFSFSLPSFPSWLAVGLLSFHCCRYGLS